MFKKHNTLFSTIVIAIVMAMTLAICFPTNAMAAEGTDDNVKIDCTYTDVNGNLVCGDELVAGTYDVSFYTHNVAKISVIEITATYDTEVVTINGVTDTIDTMTSMGTVNNDGNFVIGFVADGNYVNVDADAQLIATASVTFAQACDAEDYITVAENPNLTFIVADSTNNNYDDEYALLGNDEFEEYTQGTLTKMTCDITPAQVGDGYDITGKLMIAADATGAASNVAVSGITIDVLDADNNVVATDVTNANGEYTLAGVPAGQYTLFIHGDTTVDRYVTLDINGERQLADIGVIICDYAKDGLINLYDYSKFMSYYGGTYIYADFTSEGLVNLYDYTAFMRFYNVEITDAYTNVTL